MKKIKDTKLGAWLGDNIPQAIGIVGDLLPDSGALGIVKNLISNSDLSAERSAEGLKLVQDHELAMEKEMTARIASFQETERVQLEQDDKFTKRARPTRQYFWLLFLLLCYPVMYYLDGAVLDLPEIVLLGIFGDFGFYTWKRTEEKKLSLK